MILVCEERTNTIPLVQRMEQFLRLVFLSSPTENARVVAYCVLFSPRRDISENLTKFLIALLWRTLFLQLQQKTLGMETPICRCSMEHANRRLGESIGFIGPI